MNYWQVAYLCHKLFSYSVKRGSFMKVIFTVNSYYPLRDGVQAVTKYYAEGLAAKGHDVTVITRSIPHTEKEEVYNGVKIIRLNIYTKHAIHRGDKKRYRTLILELCKEADVLVNVCTQTPTTDWLLQILDKIKCKKFLYMHGMIDFKWRKENFKSLFLICSKIWNNIRWRVFYKTSLKYLRKYDVISHLHYFDEANIYFRKHKVNNCIVLQNSADENFFQNKLEIRNDLSYNYAICVSNYIDRKNQEFCLEAFYQAKTVDFSLIFIGSEENEYYKKLVRLNKEFKNKYGSGGQVFTFDISLLSVKFKISLCQMLRPPLPFFWGKSLYVLPAFERWP